MTRKRRSFRAEFKARVALETIKNQHTLQEIASRFEVHPNPLLSKLAIREVGSTS